MSGEGMRDEDVYHCETCGSDSHDTIAHSPSPVPAAHLVPLAELDRLRAAEAERDALRERLARVEAVVSAYRPWHDLPGASAELMTDLRAALSGDDKDSPQVST